MLRTHTLLLVTVGPILVSSCNGSSVPQGGSTSPASAILIEFPTRSLAGTAGLLESAVADVDGDGLFDLIEINVSAAELRIALGDGGANFLPAQVLTPAGSPLTMAVGDYDGDGVDEIAVASVLESGFAGFTMADMDDDLSTFAGATARLQVFDQPAPGELFVPALETTLPSVPLQISSGNFGSPQDAVIVPLPGDREVWLLEPTLGELLPVAVIPSTGEIGDATPLSAVAVELNADGRLDLLVGEADFDGDGPGAVACFVQNDSGGFDPERHGLQSPLLPLMVAVKDLDGDGNTDAVGVDLADGADAVVSYGAGSGALQVFGVHVVGARASGAAVGDFDGDAADDLAVASFDSGELLVLPLDGSSGPGAPLDLGLVPRGMRMLDLDGDGFDDLAAHHANGTTFYSGSPSGLLGIRGFEVPLASQFLRAADLDGDGFDDVVTLDLFQRELAFLRGAASGDLEFVSSLPLEPTTSETPGAFELGDFDGDGDL
ncbi:MAG: VCBS repeat-containing protein, partial [Planctomycetota bacterium]